MFERYTEKARRVIFFARYEASQFGSLAIEPEHLLLGVLREDKAMVSRFFQHGQVSQEKIREEVERRTPPREKITTSVELPLAPETKRVLAYAHEESDRLQHRHIGTEHLLLGLLREDCSMAAEILSEHGLRLNGAREDLANEQALKAGDELGTAVTGWLDEIHSYGGRLVALSEHLRRELSGSAVGNSSNLNEQLVAKVEERVGSGECFMEEWLKPGAMRLRTGMRTVLGFERLLRERIDLLRGARVGLICNQSSVDHQLRHAADLLFEQSDIKLTTLFGPQHGIRGDVQDNMVETAHAADRQTGLPVYSLYSETREPTEEMLKDVDTLVFDMQDVGCRIYTFVYTLANCLRAAKKYGKRVVVCDRPNPINCVDVAGTVLEPEYASFVGQFPIATRHGMTVCELARLFNEYFGIGCEMEIIKMEGWARELWLDETDAPWVIPSPNMPTLDSATVFPGAVHVEGTQLSEGRGTTKPFELIGAPYIFAEEYARELTQLGFAGVYFRACGFQPTFQKHAGCTCGGVQIHVTNRREFEPVSVGVATVKVAHDLYPKDFRWKEPPYEYVYDKNPFDVISGTNKLRAAIERGDSIENITDSWQDDLQRFKEVRATYLLY
jgi:uncharacterized protein YbbC (DUF1343 family)